MSKTGLGPCSDCVLVCVNVSALRPHLSGLLEQVAKGGAENDGGADAVFFQEHCVAMPNQDSLRKMSSAS
eukprot:11846744-Alexandrium_andersonii.AAC.1